MGTGAGVYSGGAGDEREVRENTCSWDRQSLFVLKLIDVCVAIICVCDAKGECLPEGLRD